MQQITKKKTTKKLLPQSLFISSFHSNWRTEMRSGLFHIVYVLLCFLVLWVGFNVLFKFVFLSSIITKLLWKLIKSKYFCSVSIANVPVWIPYNASSQSGEKPFQTFVPLTLIYPPPPMLCFQVERKVSTLHK